MYTRPAMEYHAGRGEERELGASRDLGHAFRTVFGAESEAGFARHDLTRQLAFAFLVALLLFLRRPDSLLYPQFWAEDGAEFFYFQLQGASLFKPYSGYLHLVPRAVAMLAGLFPARQAPLVYNLAALILAAVCSSWFALPQFRHLAQSDLLRGLACLLIALMPAAGTVLGNLTNVQWYLLIWLGLVCFQPLPSTIPGKTALIAAYSAAVLSSIVAVVLAPALMLRALMVKKDRWFCLLLAAIPIVYAVVLKTWLEPAGPGAAASFLGTMTSLSGLMISRVGIMGIFGPSAPALFASHHPAMFATGGLGLTAIVAAALWRAQPRGPFAAFTVLVFYLAASSISMLVLFRAPRPPDDLFYTIGGSRYFFFGVAVFYLWMAAAADKLKQDKWPRRAGIVLAIVIALAVAGNFRAEPLEDADWPRWAAGLEEAGKSKTLFVADVPINPRGWFIRGSGKLPPNLDRLGPSSLSVSSPGMEKINGVFRPEGPEPCVILNLKRPRYLYEVIIRYSLTQEPGAANASASIFWRSGERSRYKTDPKLPPLAPTPAGDFQRQIFIFDTVTELKLVMKPGIREFRPAEIVILAAPDAE